MLSPREKVSAWQYPRSVLEIEQGTYPILAADAGTDRWKWGEMDVTSKQLSVLLSQCELDSRRSMTLFEDKEVW
jgi:hypothetical protein